MSTLYPYAKNAVPPLPALTGVRFVAAFAVFLGHFGEPLLGTAPIYKYGGVGVTLFFVLSGFILTYVYWDEDDKQAFWSARFARIYPVYLVTLILCLPVYLESIGYYLAGVHPAEVGAILATFPLLLQAWIPQHAHVWHNVGWSLSAEAFFYAVFPFVLPLLKRTRTPLLLVFFFWLASVAMSLYDASASAVTKFPLIRVPEFLIGIVFGVMFRKGGIPPRWTTEFSLLIILATLYFGAAFPHAVVSNGLLAPMFGLLIWDLTQRSVLSRILSTKSLVFLGEASYAFYLVHFAAFLLLLRLARSESKVLSLLHPVTPLGAILTFVVSLALAILLYRFVEVPSRIRIINVLRMRLSGPSAAS